MKKFVRPVLIAVLVLVAGAAVQTVPEVRNALWPDCNPTTGECIP